MSQSQRNVGFTPFSRDDFYDKTYLQKLRNDVKRLDNADYSANTSHPALPSANAGGRAHLPLSPRPTGSSRKRNSQALVTNSSSDLLHPGRYSSRSKTPRSLSRSHSRNQNESGRRSSITPRKQLRNVSPGPDPTHKVSPGPSRSPRVSPNVLGSNLIQLPSIERSHSQLSTKRGPTMSREKSNLLLKASLEKKAPFPKIGLSELPSITITKKPVTPQNPTNTEADKKPSYDAHHSHNADDRLSRRDHFLHSTLHNPFHHRKRLINGHIMEVPLGGYRHNGDNRFVISPTNINVYGNRAVAESLVSAVDDLAALAIHGEKLTPHGSPRASPFHSPHQYTHPLYLPSRSPNPPPARGNQYRVSPTSRQPSISPGHSPIRDAVTNKSPAGSVYGGSPSHSPNRFFNNNSRRGSDVSNYSGDDVSLHNYLVQTAVNHTGTSFTPHQSPYQEKLQYNPVNVAGSRNVSPNRVVLLDPQQNPILVRQATELRDMATQTFSSQEKTIKPKSYQERHNKRKSSKKTSKQSKIVVQKSGSTADDKDLSIVLYSSRKSSHDGIDSKPSATSGEKVGRKKAVLVMKTVTTVTPTSELGSNRGDMFADTPAYSRESTVHIDIDYDGNSTAEDILKSAVIADVPNARISSMLIPKASGKSSEQTTTRGTPLEGRRSSVSGPIPQISLICASPDELTPASPGIPKIDGDEGRIAALS